MAVDPHVRHAWTLKVRGGGATKLVLLLLADKACEWCGFVWPGLAYIGDKTQLGETRIRKALDELEADGLLVVHAYGKGGRARATEFVIFPGLSRRPPPCADCRDRMKTPRHARGLTNDPEKQQNPTRREGFQGVKSQDVAIPLAFEAQNPSRREPHPPVTDYPPRASAIVEAPASPVPALKSPEPENLQNRLRRASEMVAGFHAHERGRSATHGQGRPTAEDADRETPG